jgi:hypothetical protein
MADYCSICLCELEVDLATVENCSHTFHSQCLKQWSERKALCPNCNMPYKSWTRADDNLLEYVGIQKSSEEADLSCLDHSFFKEELAALTRYAETINREKFIGRFSKATAYERQVFAQTRDKIAGLSEANKIYLQYDTVFLMQEITQMHGELVSLKNGSYSEVELRIEDAWDSESSFDDYEDYYED